jgi:cytochrome c oxidase assembly factor CtaG
LAALGLVAGVVVVVPPLAASAHRYDWAEALQFMVLALVAPGLVVAGAPWELLGLGPVAEKLAAARRRHNERARTVAVAAPALACMVAWRTPAAVNALKAGGWLLALEVLSLGVAGAALWLECISSGALVPRGPRPQRIAVAAVSMWTIWVLAYLLAMSGAGWYRSYLHVPGHGISLAIDQQAASGLMWALATACFVPLIFWHLVQWLHAEEDADHELHRVVREERRRALSPARPTDRP